MMGMGGKGWGANRRKTAATTERSLGMRENPPVFQKNFLGIKLIYGISCFKIKKTFKAWSFHRAQIWINFQVEGWLVWVFSSRQGSEMIHCFLVKSAMIHDEILRCPAECRHNKRRKCAGGLWGAGVVASSCGFNEVSQNDVSCIHGWFCLDLFLILLVVCVILWFRCVFIKKDRCATLSP